MNKKNILKYLITVISFAVILFLIGSDVAEAKGSFGGSRGGGGFGGSKGGGSFGGSRSSAPSGSFGSGGGLASRSSTMPRMSFGGNRLSSAGSYTAKYGIPRQTIPAGTMAGIPSNYVVHQYGGYGSGLLTGYLMGQSSWMWYMPFHPAFYYSRPYYVENPDGTVEAYPPTFSFSKLLFTIMIFGAIVYIIYVVIRNKRHGGSYHAYSQSSFS